MAFTLDYGVIGQLSGIFLWLLIFLIAYGLLRVTDFFKLEDAGKGMYGLIAAVIAILLVISDVFVTVLAFSLPWLSLIVFALFFLLFFAKIADPNADPTKEGGPGKGIVIGLIVIVFLFGLGQVFSPNAPSQTASSSEVPVDTFVPADQGVQETTTSSSSSAAAVIFHPNILGMAVVLLVAMTALLTITKAE